MMFLSISMANIGIKVDSFLILPLKIAELGMGVRIGIYMS